MSTAPASGSCAGWVALGVPVAVEVGVKVDVDVGLTVPVALALTWAEGVGVTVAGGATEPDGEGVTVGVTEGPVVGEGRVAEAEGATEPEGEGVAVGVRKGPVVGEGWVAVAKAPIVPVAVALGWTERVGVAAGEGTAEPDGEGALVGVRKGPVVGEGCCVVAEADAAIVAAAIRGGGVRAGVAEEVAVDERGVAAEVVAVRAGRSEAEGTVVRDGQELPVARGSSGSPVGAAEGWSVGRGETSSGLPDSAALAAAGVTKPGCGGTDVAMSGSGPRPSAAEGISVGGIAPELMADVGTGSGSEPNGAGLDPA